MTNKDRLLKSTLKVFSHKESRVLVKTALVLQKNFVAEMVQKI